MIRFLDSKIKNVNVLITLYYLFLTAEVTEKQTNKRKLKNDKPRLLFRKSR